MAPHSKLSTSVEALSNRYFRSCVQIDTRYLAFLCRDEAHAAAYRQFDGTSRIEQPTWPGYKKQSKNVYEASTYAREMAQKAEGQKLAAST